MQEVSLETNKKSKPIVIIVVEGESDKTYLLNPIYAIYRKKYGAKTVFVPISDITSFTFGQNGSVGKLFDTLLEPKLQSSRFKIDEDTANNIKEVVHIIDIDSCYISDSEIFEDDSLEKVLYTEKNIKCKNKDSIIKRNLIKRNQIDVLIKKDSCDVFGCKIPYKLYYFSINIDHFFVNKLNLSDVEKAFESEHIFKKYVELEFDYKKITAFKNYFIEINPSDMPNTYLETWKYISSSNNCLKRCSNLFLITENI